MMQHPRTPWSQEYWEQVTSRLERRALAARSDTEACRTIGRQACDVLRAYSSSFFVVTRFLPYRKRTQVEAIYAAVRYPDEIVDTFPLAPEDKLRLLDRWAEGYETALDSPTTADALVRGAPCFTALFASVVRAAGIPPEHYRSFLQAMRLDACPRPFASLEDLVESYVYGSAIVVGYFLAHVYGAEKPGDFGRALTSARHLAIALQLTNFLRDVAEDQRRGRLYLPLDLLRAEGISDPDVTDPSQHGGFARVRRRLAATADGMYAASAADLDAFAADSRTAIRACIDVYRKLNDRIGVDPRGLLQRATVPFTEKIRVLPASKYWRLPIAYLAH